MHSDANEPQACGKWGKKCLHTRDNIVYGAISHTHSLNMATWNFYFYLFNK